MDIRKLQRAIVDGLEDVKAQDIAVFNTEHLSPLFERVIVASGTSNRQTKALASSVSVSVKSSGGEVLSIEGEDNGEWIIVDCGTAVVHVMQPAIRQYYHLEEIWGGKAVKMKMGAARTGLAKASEPADGRAEAPAAKRGKIPAASQSPLPPEKKPVRARKPAVDGTAPAARKAPARKTGARKAAPVVVETLVVNAPKARKTAAKSASKPAGKPAASATGRAPARKAATKTPRA